MFILQVILLSDRPFHEDYLIIGKRLAIERKAIAGLNDGIFYDHFTIKCAMQIIRLRIIKTHIEYVGG